MADLLVEKEKERELNERKLANSQSRIEEIEMRLSQSDHHSKQVEAALSHQQQESKTLSVSLEEVREERDGLVQRVDSLLSELEKVGRMRSEAVESLRRQHEEVEVWKGKMGLSHRQYERLQSWALNGINHNKKRCQLATTFMKWILTTKKAKMERMKDSLQQAEKEAESAREEMEENMAAFYSVQERLSHLREDVVGEPRVAVEASPTPPEHGIGLRHHLVRTSVDLGDLHEILKEEGQTHQQKMQILEDERNRLCKEVENMHGELVRITKEKDKAMREVERLKSKVEFAQILAQLGLK